MIMSFFKKVMTFFSVIWNAILWRKPNSKTKKPTKSIDENQRERQRLNSVSDSEKSFVDVPLHPPVTDFSIEPDINIEISDKPIRQPYTPIIAPLIGGGYQDTKLDTNERVSFYSEPLHGKECEDTCTLSLKEEKEEVEHVDIQNEAAVKNGAECESIQTVVSLGLTSDELVGVDRQDQNNSNTSTSDSKPESFANDSVDFDTIPLTEGPVSQAITGEISVVEVSYPEIEAGALTANDEMRNPVAMSTAVTTGASFFETNSHIECPAIGDVVHLFENQSYSNLSEIIRNDRVDQTTTTAPLQDDDIPCEFATSPTLEPSTDEKNPEDPVSSTNVLSAVGISVSSTKSSNDSKDNVTDEMDKYATNYLVRSDSLVNFLPVNPRDPALSLIDHAGIVEEKSASSVASPVSEMGVTNSRRDSCMEEMMCTPRGILRLSGDHELDKVVTPVPGLTDDVQNVMDDFVSGIFYCEEPPLGVQHNEAKSTVAAHFLGNQHFERHLPISTPVLCDFAADGFSATHVVSTRNSIEGLPVANAGTDASGNKECGEVDESPHSSTTLEPFLDDFIMDSFSLENPSIEFRHKEGRFTVATPREYDFEIADRSEFHEVIATQNFTELSPGADTDIEAQENMGSGNSNGLSSVTEEYSVVPKVSSPIPNEPKSNKCRWSEGHDDVKNYCDVRHLLIAPINETKSSLGQATSHDIPSSSVSMYDRDTSFNAIQRSSEIRPIVQEGDESRTSNANQQVVDRIYVPGILNEPVWYLTLPSTILEGPSDTIGPDSTRRSITTKREHTFDKMSSDSSVDDPERDVDENINGFYPYMDCSSFLFRIPEEIRKEGTFNPCVGTDPSRKFDYPKTMNGSLVKIDEEEEDFEMKFLNGNATDQHFVGSVPLIAQCVSDDYEVTGVPKLPSECDFNRAPIPNNCRNYWSPHSGMVHCDEHPGLIGYPMNCTGNVYPDKGVNPIPPESFEDTHTCSPPESYDYVDTYGQIEFPMLNIPLCEPPPHAAFLPGGSVPPLIFPIGTMDMVHNQSQPVLMRLENTVPVDDPSLISPSYWGGFQPGQIDHQRDGEAEENELEAVVEMSGLTQAENLSVGTNEDDLDSTIVDPLFHLAENASLHTVRSKADSFTGSLFCESLRSIISHNAENDSIFPSFSCSSVPGLSPSAVVLQSCDTTISSDSLPSIIVEESRYSKNTDDDYLATEKFMNDVNTALNESVIDQIQGRMDHLQRNLLGRGDGSMTVESSMCDSVNPDENPPNDFLVGNSLEGNLSVNNSKLTLLDGALGTEGDTIKFETSQCHYEQSRVVEDRNTNAIYGYCLDVIDSLLAEVVAAASDRRSVHNLTGVSFDENDEGEEVDDELHFKKQTDIVVQHSLISLNPVDVMQICAEDFGHQMHLATSDGDLDGRASDTTSVIHQENARTVPENPDTEFTFDGLSSATVTSSSRKVRRNRGRRKKLSENEQEIHSEMNEIGDGVGPAFRSERLDEDQCSKSNCHNPQTSLKNCTSKAQTSKPNGGGETFTNSPFPVVDPGMRCVEPTLEVAVDRCEVEGEAEELEHVASSSNNRKRRNRRKKKKN